MKKYLTWVLALMMALGLQGAALAATDPTTGSTASVDFNPGELEFIDQETDSRFASLAFNNMDIPFGNHDIPVFQDTYTAIERDSQQTYGIVISDSRGIVDPEWALAVKITDPFTHTDTTITETFDAQIVLEGGTPGSNTGTNATLATGAITVPSSTNTDVPVMSGQNLGVGAFYATWAMADISMELGDNFRNIRPGAYETTMVWTITPAVVPSP